MKETFSKGLDAWLWQRITSLFLTAYILPVLLFWMLPQAVTMDAWRIFLFSVPMRVLGGLAAISLLIHACIGIWVVATDYIQVDGYQQIVLTVFYMITVISSMVLIIGLWSPQMSV